VRQNSGLVPQNHIQRSVSDFFHTGKKIVHTAQDRDVEMASGVISQDPQLPSLVMHENAPLRRNRNNAPFSSFGQHALQAQLKAHASLNSLAPHLFMPEAQEICSTKTSQSYKAIQMPQMSQHPPLNTI